MKCRRKLATLLLAGVLPTVFMAGQATHAQGAAGVTPAPPPTHAVGWGDNLSGQLGNGNPQDVQATFVQVADQVHGFIKVDTGGDHSVAVAADGSVWAWGGNQLGQLGNGTLNDSLIPIHVTGLPPNIVDISSGAGYSLAVAADGSVWAWGFNRFGQLGDGTTTDRPTPVQLPGIAKISKISAGGFHSLAVGADGKVWAWGLNGSGRLGDGTNINRHSPVQVAGLPNIVNASAGSGAHSLAVGADGRAWAWGRNTSGQLGDGTQGSGRNVPGTVPGISGITTVAGGSDYSLALRADGSVLAWGDNFWGQLGDGTSQNVRPTPVHTAISGVTKIAAASEFSAAVRADGRVFAWGHNDSGQLGDGTTTDHVVPAAVSGLTRVREITAQGQHALAIRVDHEFTISVAAGPVDTDGSITVTATTAPLINGHKPTIKLLASGCGSGVVATPFDPATVVAGESSTVTLFLDQGAKSKACLLTVTGSTSITSETVSFKVLIPAQ